MFACLFVYLCFRLHGMPVVALLPWGRLSQGTQSIPGLWLKKLIAAWPLVFCSQPAWLWPTRSQFVGRSPLSPNLAGSLGHFEAMLSAAAQVCFRRPSTSIGVIRKWHRSLCLCCANLAARAISDMAVGPNPESDLGLSDRRRHLMIPE